MFWPSDKVPVIWHHTIAADPHGNLFECLLHNVLKRFVVRRATQQSLSAHAPIEHMKHHSTRSNSADFRHKAKPSVSPVLQRQYWTCPCFVPLFPNTGPVPVLFATFCASLPDTRNTSSPSSCEKIRYPEVISTSARSLQGRPRLVNRHASLSHSARFSPLDCGSLLPLCRTQPAAAKCVWSSEPPGLSLTASGRRPHPTPAAGCHRPKAAAGCRSPRAYPPAFARSRSRKPSSCGETCSPRCFIPASVSCDFFHQPLASAAWPRFSLRSAILQYETHRSRCHSALAGSLSASRC